MNPICAVTGKTMAEIINDPILFHLVDALIKEGVSVARANEFQLGSNYYPYCIDYIRNAGHHKPSMLQDIEAGRRTEGGPADRGRLHQRQDRRVRRPGRRPHPVQHDDPRAGQGARTEMIREKVARLAARMHDRPQYPSQGAVLFVDLERREHFRKYLPVGVLRSFLSGRGANMFLLHNLLLDGREPLD
ncbi:MAG: branched-chain 2-oxoacid (Si)-reductase, 2-oxopantoate 2-reductase family, partial [Deltaproteobacteria bacterium]|nr:branched-chain 2-oxoacid (Si)-reductase, 2-oxopantoate 2-reductase family [Deltaproteobacteria bacterium]